MHTRFCLLGVAIVGVVAGSAWSADWVRFRGPGGLGITDDAAVPLRWSATENIVWQRPLPGPGASSPIVSGERVFVTCYSGYGVEAGSPGDQQNLMRHVLCLNRRDGEIIWEQQFAPVLPESEYEGNGAHHGYAGSTPTTDGERLYVFFGTSGVFCFDLDGNQLWRADVGDETDKWGSACSPILYDNLLIVNASVESSALVALDKRTGAEVWRAKGIGSSWNTPIVVGEGEAAELVVSVRNEVFGFDPRSGEKLWDAEGVDRYVCPSVVAHDGVAYVIGGGHTSLAVRTGGRGNVTNSHVVWRKSTGANVPSPIYVDGHLYWPDDGAGTLVCQDASTGEIVSQQRLSPRPGRIWASPVLADGRLYLVSQHAGTYVVAAQPEFELLAHNVIEGDESRTNASPGVSDGQLFLRSDSTLYCIGVD